MVNHYLTIIKQNRHPNAEMSIRLTLVQGAKPSCQVIVNHYHVCQNWAKSKTLKFWTPSWHKEVSSITRCQITTVKICFRYTCEFNITQYGEDSMTDLTQYSEKVRKRYDYPSNVKENLLWLKELLLFRREGSQWRTFSILVSLLIWRAR